MFDKKVVYNYKHDTVTYGVVCNDTEEYYHSFSACKARGDELRADNSVAYVMDGYHYPSNSYRVVYAYKA